jgi:hypothetical protein
MLAQSVAVTVNHRVRAATEPLTNRGAGDVTAN